MLSLYIKEEPELQDVFDFLDKCHDKKESAVKIYVDCGGGTVSDFKTIMKRLNWMVDLGYDITMHIMYAGSAAFRFCYEFKGKIELESDADGMIHMTYITIPSYRGKVIHQDGTGRGRKEYYEATEMPGFPFLTPEEKLLFDEGKDVYFNPDRMKEIFSNRLT